MVNSQMLLNICVIKASYKVNKSSSQIKID